MDKSDQQEIERKNLEDQQFEAIKQKMNEEDKLNENVTLDIKKVENNNQTLDEQNNKLETETVEENNSNILDSIEDITLEEMASEQLSSKEDQVRMKQK